MERKVVYLSQIDASVKDAWKQFVDQWTNLYGSESESEFVTFVLQCLILAMHTFGIQRIETVLEDVRTQRLLVGVVGYREVDSDVVPS